jgi:hypothetical protein
MILRFNVTSKEFENVTAVAQHGEIILLTLLLIQCKGQNLLYDYKNNHFIVVVGGNALFVYDASGTQLYTVTWTGPKWSLSYYYSGTGTGTLTTSSQL